MKVAVVIEMTMLEVFDTEITKMEADNVTHVPLRDGFHHHFQRIKTT